MVWFTVHRRMARRFAATVMASALALVGAVPGYVRFRCGMDLVARPACCCPAVEQAGALPVSTLTKRCCCDIETTTLSGTPGQVSRAELAKLAPLPPAASWSAPSASQGFPGPLLQALDHPGTGPPILLLKHSLLL